MSILGPGMTLENESEEKQLLIFCFETKDLKKKNNQQKKKNNKETKKKTQKPLRYSEREKIKRHFASVKILNNIHVMIHRQSTHVFL